MRKREKDYIYYIYLCYSNIITVSEGYFNNHIIDHKLYILTADIFFLHILLLWADMCLSCSQAFADHMSLFLIYNK